MDVIDELITHCEAWEPWARVMGNVCAGDAAQALRNLRAENEALLGTLRRALPGLKWARSALGNGEHIGYSIAEISRVIKEADAAMAAKGE